MFQMYHRFFTLSMSHGVFSLTIVDIVFIFIGGVGMWLFVLELSINPNNKFGSMEKGSLKLLNVETKPNSCDIVTFPKKMFHIFQIS